uniref:Uncharacterized protein n=1 Tax=Aegilops tauschii subsp. strangulata TaxID=200361 RepID=A0A453KDE2_AEGTS
PTHWEPDSAPQAPRKGENQNPAWRSGASLSAPVSSSPRRRRKVRRLALFPVASASFTFARLHWVSPSVRDRPWRGLFSIAVVRCDVMAMDLLESQENLWRAGGCRGTLIGEGGKPGAFCSALARPDFDFWSSTLSGFLSVQPGGSTIFQSSAPHAVRFRNSTKFIWKTPARCRIIRCTKVAQFFSVAFVWDPNLIM